MSAPVRPLRAPLYPDAETYNVMAVISVKVMVAVLVTLELSLVATTLSVWSMPFLVPLEMEEIARGLVTVEPSSVAVYVSPSGAVQVMAVAPEVL